MSINAYTIAQKYEYDKNDYLRINWMHDFIEQNMIRFSNLEESKKIFNTVIYFDLKWHLMSNNPLTNYNYKTFCPITGSQVEFSIGDAVRKHYKENSYFCLQQYHDMQNIKVCMIIVTITPTQEFKYAETNREYITSKDLRYFMNCSNMNIRAKILRDVMVIPLEINKCMDHFINRHNHYMNMPIEISKYDMYGETKEGKIKHKQDMIEHNLKQINELALENKMIGKALTIDEVSALYQKCESETQKIEKTNNNEKGLLEKQREEIESQITDLRNKLEVIKLQIQTFDSQHTS